MIQKSLSRETKAFKLLSSVRVEGFEPQSLISTIISTSTACSLGNEVIPTADLA